MERFVRHTLEPVYDKHSRVLILGTMPSPKSREAGFYYMHPRNRFWTALSQVLGEPMPADNEERRKLLLRHGVALWDVLASCDIDGADDGSIKNPVPNDIGSILACTEIQTIFTTGKKATELYKQYCYPFAKQPSIYLPSTSPANCRHSTEQDLIEAYRQVARACGR